MKFFCSQCRKVVEVDNFEEFRTKTNLLMAKTQCPVCGLVLYRRLDTDYQIASDRSQSSSKNK